MGTVCTRNCTFCSVTKGIPGPLDKNEIHRIITAAKVMKLNHVVITSVTRDDLPDGGASFIAEIVHTFRKSLPKITIEILIPDLKGDLEALETVFAGRPDILNHNIETVPSLYRDIRPQANYNRSLLVLSAAKKSGLLTKSGLMVGLGEKTHEVLSVLDDLKRVGCSIVTIGQYLQPSSNQKQVKRYISPEEFQQYATYGENAGIKKVMAGPYVRSSYHAAEVMEEIA
jgi:lipoic acid synthetase